jgi:hypothetical protein
MTDRTFCIRCNRTIDASAKACPFCSWDQAETPPPRREGAAPAQTYYTPPRETFWGGRILGSLAFVALLIIAFVVGALVHGADPTDGKGTTIAESTTHPTPAAAAAPPAAKSPIDLVPMAGGTTPSTESPITSAPPVTTSDGSMANPYARDDATALPQSDYAQLAQRARAEQRPNGPQFVDPRSVGGMANPPAPRVPRTDVPMASAAGLPTAGAAPAPATGRRMTRTEPVAVYQPVPSLHVGRDATARLLLTVGADGRVKDIDITQALPGDTARLIASVQEWRFRPATENGTPVASRFSVDITFHGND